MLSLVFSHAAENDLIGIYRYGFMNYGEERAERYLQGLKIKCQLLVDNPELCRERKELAPPVRIYHYEKHLILYTINKDGILIVRVLHERMDVLV